MILVTGGAGFIGSNIVAALTERGLDVAVCDRLGPDDKWRNLAKHPIADLVAGDDWRDWLDRHGRDVKAIVHMGANSSTTEIDAERFAETNIRWTLALWQWCVIHGVRFIYASSAATYGDGSAGFDDDGRPEALARLRPLNAYGWSKHVVDRRVAGLAARGAPTPPQWVGLKLFNVFGPNEYHKGPMRSVVAQNFAKVRGGQPFALFRSHRADVADGGQRRDFIYVQDCVDVVLWLLDNPQVSGLFNLGTGRARSFAEVAAALFRALNMAVNVAYIDMPDAIRGRYQYFTEASMTRLRQAGYARPFTELEIGIADYVAHYLNADDPYR